MDKTQKTVLEALVHTAPGFRLGSPDVQPGNIFIRKLVLLKTSYITYSARHGYYALAHFLSAIISHSFSTSSFFPCLRFLSTLLLFSVRSLAL